MNLFFFLVCVCVSAGLIACACLAAFSLTSLEGALGSFFISSWCIYHLQRKSNKNLSYLEAKYPPQKMGGLPFGLNLTPQQKGVPSKKRSPHGYYSFPQCELRELRQAKPSPATESSLGIVELDGFTALFHRVTPRNLGEKPPLGLSEIYLRLGPVSVSSSHAFQLQGPGPKTW